MTRSELAPAFQCYPADVLADTAALTDEEMGLYWRLALFAWREGGLPDDREQLARRLKISTRKLAKHWPVLGELFERRGDRLMLAWQEEQRAAQAEHREKRSQAGKRGNAVRWKRDADPPPDPSQQDRNVIAMRSDCETFAIATDRSSSASASSQTAEIVTRGEMAGATSRGPAPLAGASAERPAPDLAFADLGPDVLRFAAQFYGQARSARKQDIARQLIALMNGGVPYKGAQVRAGSLDRLQAKCREVLAEDLRDPDKAIAVLLTKLSDISDDSPTERAAALARAEDRDSTAAYQAMIDRALAWAAAHPEQAAPIREQLVAMRGEPTTEGQRWLFDGEFAARLAPLMAAHPPPA